MLLMRMKIKKRIIEEYKPICKLKFKMHTAVREDLLRYLQCGNMLEEEII